MNIHPTALISPKAEIDSSAVIAPYCIIDGEVKIGAGTRVGAYSRIEGNVIIGSECNLAGWASLGLAPQDIGYKGEATGVKIGDRVTLREFVTVHRGTVNGGGITVIENDCFLMCYVHIGHDCIISRGAILVNGTTLGGHVKIHSGVNVSGFFLAHQYVEVGELAMISGMTGTRQSIPPYVIADGRPARIFRVNKVGLVRSGMERPVIRAIEEAYRLIRSGERQEALLEIDKSEYPEVRRIADFYRNSKRGVVSFVSSDSEYPKEKVATIFD
ncbi:MAG: acyl-ACP--UDP-N-acetylglucosamine O-acyltransferase [Candidatus Caenarcaniphilales bacterium]|nr:acyl-ACP--UDP-N-acetylglucosamine O-acyltransferase [Candidatus Caenarcaniphilales bacterium]